MTQVNFADIFWAVDYMARDSIALDMFSEKARRGIVHAAVTTVVDLYNEDGGTPRSKSYFYNCLAYSPGKGEFRNVMWGFSQDFISRIASDIVDCLPANLITE